MGGYDFPGSNSSVDLNALTGWIPERKSLSDKDAIILHKILGERMATGHVLATMATGELSEEMEEKSGLVPTHAYALLGIRSVGNLKFVKLKNPWAEQSWKGSGILEPLADALVSQGRRGTLQRQIFFKRSKKLDARNDESTSI